MNSTKYIFCSTVTILSLYSIPDDVIRTTLLNHAIQTNYDQSKTTSGITVDCLHQRCDEFDSSVNFNSTKKKMQ